MKLPRRRKPEAKVSATDSESDEVAAFGDLEDFAVLRHHAIRALCGTLMDRHTDCRSPHPFCGVSGHRGGDASELIQLIVQAVPQGSADTDVPNLIGIYLIRAIHGEIKEDERTKEKEITPMEYLARMVPRDTVQSRKLVVWPPKNGIYPVEYGRILNPVEGGYPTGSVDGNTNRPITDCNPEPKHCRWRYWESEILSRNPQGDLLIPEFRCLQVNGDWWVADVDVTRGLMQQVAGLDWADSPRHNFGLHDKAKDMATFAVRDYDPESEYAKVFAENGRPLYRLRD